MASEERNALAELAERLNNGYVSLVVNGRQMATFTTAAFPELDKARRIIDELAKVEYVVDLDGNKIYLPAQASQAISKCRAIAEEGEYNGNE